MEILGQILKAFEDDNFGSLLQAAAAFVIGLVIIKIILITVRKVLARSAIDSVLYKFIINSIKIICFIVLILTVLNWVGVPTSTLVTVIAAAGAAIALAVKDSLSNFAGGLLIMVNKPFSQGDYIEVDINDITGKVQEIDLLYSKLITFDNKIISIPNSILANNAVTNYSGADARRIDIQVGAGYDCDIDKVKSVIRKVIDGSDYFHRDPEPVIGVSEYADSAVIYDTFVWCDTDIYYDARYYLLENIKKSFDSEGIDIPYPQIVVHVDDDGAGRAPADER